MPSKLRRTIDAIKDQTSIGLARVAKHTAGTSSLTVAVLKATSHDDIPAEERHVNDVLLLTLSSPCGPEDCVRALNRRIARTCNWAVALKCLLLAFRILREGSPEFCHEASAPTSRPGSQRLLDLSSFSDASSASCPWDYTAFVRTFARYLDTRLELALLGKLRNLPRRGRAALNFIAEMKPPQILEHVKHWQRLLDSSICTRPTGPARTHRLAHTALYVVVRESFELYRDISNGISLLLDNFFHLQHQSCLETLQVCTKAVKQFEELESFYKLCRTIGIGRTSEYPSVQMISTTLVTSLEEFVRGRKPSSGTSPAARLRSQQVLALPSTTPEKPEAWELSPVSIFDCRSVGETITDQESVKSGKNGSFKGMDNSSKNTKNGAKESLPPSTSDEVKGYVVSDLIIFDDQQEAPMEPNPDNWELLLVENASGCIEENRQIQAETHQPPQNYINPFIHGIDQNNLAMILSPTAAIHHPPTFQAGKTDEAALWEETSPFMASVPNSSSASTRTSDPSTSQQLLLCEQQRWMQQQKKILERNLSNFHLK